MAREVWERNTFQFLLRRRPSLTAHLVIAVFGKVSRRIVPYLAVINISRSIHCASNIRPTISAPNPHSVKRNTDRPLFWRKSGCRSENNISQTNQDDHHQDCEDDLHKSRNVAAIAGFNS